MLLVDSSRSNTPRETGGISLRVSRVARLVGCWLLILLDRMPLGRLEESRWDDASRSAGSGIPHSMLSTFGSGFGGGFSVVFAGWLFAAGDGGLGRMFFTTIEARQDKMSCTYLRSSLGTSTTEGDWVSDMVVAHGRPSSPSPPLSPYFPLLASTLSR